MALNGSLDDYSPAGALRILAADGRTGAVRFNGAGGCTVYLCDGQLYFARGAETDEALAAALVRPGRLTADMWTRAVEEAGDMPRVGELLIEHGSIDPDLIASVVLSVIYDPLITLFREGDGQFDFEPDTMHWIGPYRGFNVEAIVEEVRRRARGADEMSDVVPSVSSWVSPRRSLPDGAAQVTLLREDWELITSLSGPRTIVELAASMGRGQYSTVAVVHRLTLAGLLEVVAEPFPAVPPRPAPEPVADEQTASTTDITDTDGPALGDETDVGDEAWEQWAESAPLYQDPHSTPEDDVRFGPGVGGSGAGPETAPGEAAALPRRTAVREAERPDDATTGSGLVGISGFHDPVAGMGRENVALAKAMEPDQSGDPNAAWLENLYAQFIDEPSDTGGTTKKREALDVAFQAPEQAETEKVGTLRRLVDALRRV